MNDKNPAIPGSDGSTLPSLDELRLSQDFEQVAGVRRLLTTVPVRKPQRQDFVRVRAGDENRLQTGLLTLKEERESYLVARGLWPALPTEIVPTLLVTGVNRQKVVFIWPLRLAGADGRLDNWSRSAHEAAQLAETSWVSVRANMALGAYEIFESQAELPDPDWPEETFERLIQVAFREHYISSPDHPVLQRLRGEI